MKELLTFITLILFIASCSNNKQSASDDMPPLYPAPQRIALNTEEGYIINLVTRDSIQPIVNSFGDTIETGVPVPAKGKVIHPDSVKRPVTIPSGEPALYPANLNVHKIPDALTVIPVRKESLKTFIPFVDTSSFVMVNSTGDTLSTGVPVTITGRVVPCVQPMPVMALRPGMKDNASINMKYLDVDHGMKSSYVLSILEDSNGNLWFGTWGGGVSMYNGETFRHFSEKEGLSNNIVWSILEDNLGNLWFGTEGGGLSKYNGETFLHFTEKEGIGYNYISSMLEDSKGNLWFGTTGGGVSKYDGESFVPFTRKEGLCNNSVVSILEDSHGNLWFGTDDGVSMYNGESFTHITEKEGLCDNYVSSIQEDAYGNLWFGTLGGGVNMYDGNTFTHFTEKEGLSRNAVTSILVDSHGNLWFGTLGGGVNIYNSESFTNFTEKEGLNSNLVQSILEDSNGKFWFGTDDGVSIYNGDAFTYYSEQEGLCFNDVRSILEDSNGNLWFGTLGGGVNLFNGDSFTHFTEKEGLSNNIVLSILEDNQGNIWFGTYGGGASMYNGKIFTHFTDKEGLSNNFIYSILEDSQGNLWFCTDGGGVSKYNGETFTHYTEKEGLSENLVYSILEDSHGNMWFGTDGGGVSRFDGEFFTPFTTKEGLSSNMVWSILEDNNNNIWLSTESGLNCLVFGLDSASGSKSTLSSSVMKGDTLSISSTFPQVHTYSQQDGLKGLDFFQNSVILDRKNRIWWGSGKNLTMLDMNNYKIPVVPPTVRLNRIDINEQFVDYRHLNDSEGMEMEFYGVARFYNYPLNLELPYNRNHITFHFSAIDWAAPHKIRYSFKMEGLNDIWSLPSAEPKADYRNLPYGRYNFKVRANGEGQQWSEPFEYAFTINPPWWNTWWARSGYAIIAVLFIFGFVRWRTAKLKQRQKELEKIVKERTKEIEEKNIELSQQKEEVETQRDQIEIQRDLVVAQNQEITDSINYAQRIQNAVLPHQGYMDSVMPEYFVIFMPRDIVSGDFYWIKEVKHYLIIIAADCTGHGVPGAFMSMLGITLLNEQIGKSRFDTPGEILNRLRKKVKDTLTQEGKSQEQQDGMDMALAILDKNSKELQYAGAYNPLYLIRGKKEMKGEQLEQYMSLENKEYQLFELKGDRQPIAIYAKENDFTTKQIQLRKGDSIYLFSDGFVDQVGGPDRKKFLSKNFKRSLLEIQPLSMEEQKKNLDDTLKNWKKGYEQVDDILVMGIRI